MADAETKLAISQMTAVLLMDKTHTMLDFSGSTAVFPEEVEELEIARATIRKICDIVANRAGMLKK